MLMIQVVQEVSLYCNNTSEAQSSFVHALIYCITLMGKAITLGNEPDYYEPH
jgi:hypothetical protein